MASSDESTQKFLETWSLAHHNLRMFNYWLKTFPFDINEKRLLKAFYLFKRNKKEESLSLVRAKINGNTFYEGIRYYLIGLIYNQHGHYIHAIENLQNAVRCFNEQDFNSFIINPLCLLVNTFSNRKDVKATEALIAEMDRHKELTDAQYLQKEYARMCYYTIAGKTKEATELFSKLEKSTREGFEIYRPYFIVALFVIKSKDGDFKECEKLLEVYKDFSGCVVKSNFLYMRILLDHLVKDAPFYFYKKDFKDFPELAYQLEVVKALRNGEIEIAVKFWKKLAVHNPFLYEEDFKYSGGPDLFYRSVQKYLGNIQRKMISRADLVPFKSNLEKLNFIFSQTTAPVKIEELISLIWGEEYDEASLTRLRKLVSDYSRKTGNKLKAIQGSYQRAS
jgi:tetratricopeptide (TPR) repeat protein